MSLVRPTLPIDILCENLLFARDEFANYLEKQEDIQLAADNFALLKTKLPQKKFNLLVEILRHSINDYCATASILILLLKELPQNSHDRHGLINSIRDLANLKNTIKSTQTLCEIFSLLNPTTKKYLFNRIKSTFETFCSQSTQDATLLKLLKQLQEEKIVYDNDYNTLSKIIFNNIELSGQLHDMINDNITTEEHDYLTQRFSNNIQSFDDARLFITKDEHNTRYRSLAFSLIKNKIASLPFNPILQNNELSFLSIDEIAQITEARITNENTPAKQHQTINLNTKLWSHNTLVPVLFRTNYTNTNHTWEEIEAHATTNPNSRSALTLSIISEFCGYAEATATQKQVEFNRIYAIIRNEFPTRITQFFWSEDDRRGLNNKILDCGHIEEITAPKVNIERRP